MVEPETAMVRKLIPEEGKAQERFTSLQPTYEDSVPETDDAWEYED